MIVKSAKKDVKKKFLIIKNGKIIGRTAQIGLDLRPKNKRRRK
jgi:hypothetical protein